ncbi:MAG: hypothetical protein ACTMUB_03050 [cyanobacterium endosymbiont of Rhopalodia musculus]|uniref:hypothetical protein n=1 Tax=cyanobacterium endosymbiont of Epithemia clementina EcSB TaxID=3034674 RepID=UPI00248059A0|nr:hypothetical protein [cyanobacterium endosymbiont of Epithemia clementina EcSB]WGT67192.1 hypothetical protein P3F56_08210 [cyanobacterium endosymbiont of Epithemia clementina EcSB]
MIHPQEITVKKISNRLNCPVSGVQFCFKARLAIITFTAKRASDTQEWIYYPTSVFLLKYN